MSKIQKILLLTKNPIVDNIFFSPVSEAAAERGEGGRLYPAAPPTI